MKALRIKPAIFKGTDKNFMTPNVLGYYKLSRGVYVELSVGEGMSRQPIYGVTVRPDPDHKLSTLLQSKEAAIAYIETLAGIES